MIRLLFFFILLFTFVSQAVLGKDVFRTAYYYDCPDKSIILDIDEGREFSLRNFPEFGPDVNTKDLIIKFKELETYLNFRMSLYRKRFLKLLNRIEFVTLEKMIDLEPADPLYLKGNCSLQPLAIWSGGETTLMVDENGWNKIDMLSKWALFLNILLSEEVESSVIRRQLSSLFLSTNFKTMNPVEKGVVLNGLGINWIGIQEIKLDLNRKHVFYKNGVLKNGFSVPLSVLNFQSQEMISEPKEIYFWKNGNVRNIYFKNDFVQKIGKSFIKFQTEINHRPLRFHQNGQIHDGNIYKKQTIHERDVIFNVGGLPAFDSSKIPTHGSPVKMNEQGLILFIKFTIGEILLNGEWRKIRGYFTRHQNGKRRQFYLDNPSKFTIWKRNFRLSRYITYDKNGRLREGHLSKSRWVRFFNQKIYFKKKQKIQIHYDGDDNQVEKLCGVIGKKTTVFDIHGKIKILKKSNFYCFNEKGQWVAGIFLRDILLVLPVWNVDDNSRF